jgi:O-antigen ligase
MTKAIAPNVPYLASTLSADNFSRARALQEPRTLRIPSRRARWHKHAPVLPLILWVCLWLNLNTGFWNINPPYSADDWQLMFRALLPFAVLPIATFIFFRRAKARLAWNGPSSLLMVYGIIATLAAIFSPFPLWSLYWSMTFLATILVAWTFVDRHDPIEATRTMLQVTWVAAFVIAAILAYQTRGSVFSDASSAYGFAEVEVAGLSRSSGIARWAAVPGLVCLIRAYHSRRPLLIVLFLGFSGVAFFIVYRMQSRGAVFGAAAALIFALFVSSRMRRYALPFALLTIAVILLVDSPATVSNGVTEYLERGQTEEQFVTMTGRTRAYESGLVAFEEAPLFGRGQWADRLTIHEHVHNSYLQAFMNAGVVGGIPYVMTWVSGWILFFKLQKQSAKLSQKDRLCLLEAGTVMMFFTVRSIPETTTASYAVDLLVMVAVYVYLESLAIHLRLRRQAWRVQSFHTNASRRTASAQPHTAANWRAI